MGGLLKSDIRSGFDGNLWIYIRRQKTKKEYSIPLLPQAITIISKFDILDSSNVFPKITNQKFNAYLKEIADLARINIKLTHHIARKTFATTILLSNGVSMDVASRMLGHSSIKHTTHYGKVIDQTLSQTIKKLRNDFADRSSDQT